MNRLLPGIAVLGRLAVLGTLLAASQTFAVDAVNSSPSSQRQSTLTQRQLKGCMIKRMAADRVLAYNDAKRACTDRLRALNDNPPRPLAAAAAQTGP